MWFLWLQIVSFSGNWKYGSSRLNNTRSNQLVRSTRCLDTQADRCRFFLLNSHLPGSKQRFNGYKDLQPNSFLHFLYCLLQVLACTHMHYANRLNVTKCGKLRAICSIPSGRSTLLVRVLEDKFNQIHAHIVFESFLLNTHFNSYLDDRSCFGEKPIFVISCECGVGNVFGVYVSVRAISFEAVNRNFIFGMVVHLDHIQVK